MIKMIVFDMAGTVVNENNVVYKTVQLALQRGGINITLEQVLADGAGKEKSKAISDLALKFNPSVNDDAIDNMYHDFVTLLDRAYEDLHVTPIEGAEKLFHQLKEMGILRILNTGYSKRTAMKLVTKLGWIKDRDYDDIVTASEVPKTRPHPDMIFMAMELMGINNADEVVKVGDSAIDIEEGKNADCGLTVGITTGAHTRDQLAAANPDFIIDNLADLLPLLKERASISAVK